MTPYLTPAGWVAEGGEDEMGGQVVARRSKLAASSGC